MSDDSPLIPTLYPDLAFRDVEKEARAEGIERKDTKPLFEKIALGPPLNPENLFEWVTAAMHSLVDNTRNQYSMSKPFTTGDGLNVEIVVRRPVELRRLDTGEIVTVHYKKSER